MNLGDHDFTKFSLIPSVSLVVDIPDDVTQSWYTGNVFNGLKEGAFEPSSPHRYMTELCEIVKKENPAEGPDHRLTYLSVQLSLIAIFLELDLDFVCAARTAACHSWRNPAERMMSIVNLGLQCVGMMRGKMSDDHEASISALTCPNFAKLLKRSQM